MMDGVEGILKSVESEARRNLDGQIDLFGALDGEQESGRNVYKLPDSGEEYPYDILLQMEKEVSGLYLSGHPLDHYRPVIEKVSTCRISELVGENAHAYDEQNVTLVCTVVRTKTINTKAGGMMALNDRLKLRSMVCAEKGEAVYFASEECAIRVMEPDVETLWAPRGGQAVVVRLNDGVTV